MCTITHLLKLSRKRNGDGEEEQMCEPTMSYWNGKEEQDETDLLKHHLVIAVYLCDCIYIHNKGFKLVLCILFASVRWCVCVDVFEHKIEAVSRLISWISHAWLLFFFWHLLFFSPSVQPFICFTHCYYLSIFSKTLWVNLSLLQIPVCIWCRRSRCGFPLFCHIHPVTPTSL